jgi:hypothetical protein
MDDEGVVECWQAFGSLAFIIAFFYHIFIEIQQLLL